MLSTCSVLNEQIGQVSIFIVLVLEREEMNNWISNIILLTNEIKIKQASDSDIGVPLQIWGTDKAC